MSLIKNRPGWRRMGWQPPIPERDTTIFRLGGTAVCVRARKNGANVYECFCIAEPRWFGDGVRLWCAAHRWVTVDEIRFVPGHNGNEYSRRMAMKK